MLEDFIDKTDEEVAAGLEAWDTPLRLYQRLRAKPAHCHRCYEYIGEGKLAVYVSDSGYEEPGAFSKYVRMCPKCWEVIRHYLDDSVVDKMIRNELSWRKKKEEAAKARGELRAKRSAEKENPVRNMLLTTAILNSGRKQYELATECGISETRLSRLVKRGLTPTDEEKRKLSTLLGVPAHELFTPRGDEVGGES